MLLQRFRSRVDKNGPIVRKKIGPCHLWTGALTTGGYGSLTIGSRKNGTRRTILAHRLAWWLDVGEESQLNVLHVCDTPRCVRRSHLYEGTHHDNFRDQVERNRRPSFQGVKNPNAILTPIIVRIIRERREAGEKQQRLAEEFGVSQQQISSIVRGMSW